MSTREQFQRWRYNFIPDHLIGEILSKRWADNAIPFLAMVITAGAAYGLMVAVFQKGWGAGILGLQKVDFVEAWVPLFLFAVLFGTSMDYHVFILSRVREAVDRGRTTDEAVREGILSTASTVTSAAFVMVAVFAVFATLGALEFKQMGVGLAVAGCLIDLATKHWVFSRLGMPDARLGERVCTFVVLARGVDVEPDELQRRFVAYLDALQVAKFKWPERVEIVDAIPKTGIGKPLKHVLRERLVADVRRRLRASWEQRGASDAELGWVDEVLDPDVLTIGFARRVPSACPCPPFSSS